MGSFSDYIEAKVLDAVFGATALPTIGTHYIALYTVAPSDSGGGTEVTGGSYARHPVTNNTTNWPNASGTNPCRKSNGVAFTWAAAPTANWGLVVAFAIFDQSSGGNMLGWSLLGTSKTINSGDAAPSFAIGALTIDLD